MVQLQQRLEVALQELANLERFTKQQQQPTSALPNVERLLKEESYLQARLLYVQQVRSLGGSPRHLISVLTLFRHRSRPACAWAGAGGCARRRAARQALARGARDGGRRRAGHLTLHSIRQPTPVTFMRALYLRPPLILQWLLTCAVGYISSGGMGTMRELDVLLSRSRQSRPSPPPPLGCCAFGHSIVRAPAL